jgi:hypothetical protein
MTVLKGSCHCGKTGWSLTGHPGSITACNCTLCRRYGGLWAYDYEGERISVEGPVASYTRADAKNPQLEILFCPSCAGVMAWRGLKTDEVGRRRMAVNFRHADPEFVQNLAIDHFDGLDAFEDLPSKGRCVRDLWF